MYILGAGIASEYTGAKAILATLRATVRSICAHFIVLFATFATDTREDPRYAPVRVCNAAVVVATLFVFEALRVWLFAACL